MVVNNIILVYNTDNEPIIINLDDICYINNDGTCFTLDSDEDIYIIHNVDKVQELMRKANITIPFLYLHDNNNDPILINIENIQHILTDNIIFINNTTISVTETINNIYKKLQVYRNNEKTEYGNVINSKVRTDSPCNTSSLKSQYKNDSNNEIKRIPILTKLY